jgi:hypothetical protein
MRTHIAALGLLLAVSSSGQHASGPDVTGGMMNGRFWQKMDET